MWIFSLSFFCKTFKDLNFCIHYSEIKERIKKTKDEKKAKKQEMLAKSSKGTAKGAAPKPTKGPKLGGGGGKRWSVPV